MELNLEIDEIDLKILFLLASVGDYKEISFAVWCEDTKKAYIDFKERSNTDKSYSQWVNGQIIALT